jgi:hypothetical protein
MTSSLSEVPADPILLQKAGNHREGIGIYHDSHGDQQYPAHRGDAPQIARACLKYVRNRSTPRAVRNNGNPNPNE